MQNQFIPLETPVETKLPLAPPAEAWTTKAVSTAESLAAEAVQTLPTTETVTALLAQTQRKIRRRKHLGWAFVAAFNVMPLLEWFSWMIPGYDEWHMAHRSLWALMMLSPVAAFFVYVLVCCITTRFDANELMRIGGKSAIPALLDAMIAVSSKSQHKTYIRALAILLPQLQATDAHLLTPRHRRKLNSLLKLNLTGNRWIHASQELVVPLLKAYEQVGDADAIPLVEQLANRKPRNRRQHDIQQAAQACLPLLRTQVGRLQPKQTLLRASAPNPAAPNVLLRPAAFGATMREDQLLHAVDRDDVPPSA